MEQQLSSSKKQLNRYPPTKYIVLGYIRQYIAKFNNKLPSDIELLLILYYDESISAEIIKYYQRYNNVHLYKQILINIRTSLLLHGCPDHDLIAETITDYDEEKYDSQTAKLLFTIGGEISTIRKNDDTIRGKLWRLVLGVGNIDANLYQNLINQKEHRDYVKIRSDSKRTFLKCKQYQCRVPEERLVRILNAYSHQYNVSYRAGTDSIAAVFLYVMPELHAFTTYCLFRNHYIPTYFYSDISRKNDYCGQYAASYLSWDILKICDKQLFDHLNPLPPHAYLWAQNAAIQTMTQPFDELQKLLDFLFCFGVHLNPIVTIAQVIVRKKYLLKHKPATLLQGILSQRKWMNEQINANDVINCSMDIICILKQNQYKKLWKQILKHSTNFNTAMEIQNEHY